MKNQPFKRSIMIINAAKALSSSSGISMLNALLSQNAYYSRGKGMNNPPRGRSRKNMAIKRASIKAINIKKHGR